MNNHELREWQDNHLTTPKYWFMRDGTPIGICHMRTGHIIHTINMLNRKASKGTPWNQWMIARLKKELEFRGVDYSRNKDNPEGPYV